MGTIKAKDKDFPITVVSEKWAHGAMHLTLGSNRGWADIRGIHNVYYNVHKHIKRYN